MNTTHEADDQSPHSTGGLAAERARRIAQLDNLRSVGVNPYPYRFDRTDSLGDIRARHAHLESGTETGDQVAVAGASCSCVTRATHLCTRGSPGDINYLFKVSSRRCCLRFDQ